MFHWWDTQCQEDRSASLTTLLSSTTDRTNRTEQPRKHWSITELQRELKQQLSHGIKEGGVSRCSHFMTPGSLQGLPEWHRTSSHFLQFTLIFFVWMVASLVPPGTVSTHGLISLVLSLQEKKSFWHLESEGLLWLKNSLHAQNRLTRVEVLEVQGLAFVPNYPTALFSHPRSRRNQNPRLYSGRRLETGGKKGFLNWTQPQKVVVLSGERPTWVARNC